MRSLLRGPKELTSARLSLLGLLFVVIISFSLRGRQDTSTTPVQRRAVRRDAGGALAPSPAVSISSNSSSSSSLLRRQDYSCDASRPCSNGACCGGGGFCGYGPTYCGAGCVSNCDAVAECGQYASPAGKTCPLNTCCSEFGFCGTTTDFCTGNCQSNCVLHPPPPAGSPKNKALNRVIGYYESWSYRSSCNKKAPSDMPLSELTHLYYAFAFIEPVTFKLTTMDAQTPEELFKLTVDTKRYNPGLKVYIAIGGWTHNDPGPYQTVFSDAASTEANRQKFADNVLKFVNLWGFDGIDIDWEYPGADDRGGTPADTENFVLLMKTLRQTFNASPRKLGITFTIPSSFWYLRWFDMPGLLKYADWANLMSYDLHGTWDANNPIGAIAQGHTNLTEIKLAAELLWRVNVKPEQVAIGFGFYGRSFELASSSCTTPGCAFKGGAKPGPCSKTSGVLMYYEIQAILDQVPGLTPVHDEDAAVKYIVWDNTQWVSYDDADTFDAKVAWANAIGFGGSLIWAVDTDDDKFSAMSGLMGHEVAHVDLAQRATVESQISIARSLQGENGQDCVVLKDQACKAASDLRCFNGETLVGWDRDGCSNDQEGKPICCPSSTAPRKCMWRGSGGDCNGQCHPGEATIALSSWGGKGAGFDGESGTGQCNRGAKALCCEAGDWKNIVGACRWTGCGDDCDGSKETEVSSVGDCSLLRSRGRKRTNCCKVSKAPPKSLTCDHNSCFFNPAACVVGEDEYGNRPTKRDTMLWADLEERGNRDFKWLTNPSALLIASRALGYPDPAGYMRRLRQNLAGLARRWFDMRSRACGDPSLRQTDFPNLDTAPAGGQVEHVVPLAFVLGRFPAVANHGRHWRPVPRSSRNPVPDGPPTRTPAINEAFWRDVWRNPNALPESFGPIRQPDQYVNEQIGSNSNPTAFTMLRDAVNGQKGRFEVFNSPMEIRRFERTVDRGVGGNETAVEEWLDTLRETVAAFQYLNDPLVVTVQDDSVARVYQALQRIEQVIPAAEGLSAHWNEAYPHYFRQVSEFTRTYMADRIRYVRNAYASDGSPFREYVLAEIKRIEDQIPNMKYAFED
ncbi:hypothetical protein QBC47DRAFT_433206 [Echria macrotheca]|uniref:chitinase n=1 Tax=Echria macrotheca TaxID=438768 RepID=A0AAJ0B5S5_9PEZI|nr:hypothetical protein QBC47DRAFT_433206 [Echria macrotheca]